MSEGLPAQEKGKIWTEYREPKLSSGSEASEWDSSENVSEWNSICEEEREICNCRTTPLGQGDIQQESGNHPTSTGDKMNTDIILSVPCLSAPCLSAAVIRKFPSAISSHHGIL